MESAEARELGDERGDRVRAFHELREARRGTFHAGVHDRADDRLLAREVVIEVAGADLRFRANLRDRRPVEAVPRETALRCLEDLGALLLVLDRIDCAHGSPRTLNVGCSTPGSRTESLDPGRGPALLFSR